MRNQNVSKDKLLQGLEIRAENGGNSRKGAKPRKIIRMTAFLHILFEHAQAIRNS